MAALRAQVVFSAAGTVFTWADVVLAAQAWGVWPRLLRRIRQGLACVRHVRTTRAFPRRSEVEAAAEAFRLARGLGAAADMRAWLAQRGLTADAWMQYVRRNLVRKRYAEQMLDLVRRYPVRSRDVWRNVRAEGFCSGLLERWATKLAGRAAAFAAGPPHAQNSLVTPPSHVCRWPGMPAVTAAERGAAVARLEAAFTAFRVRAVTPAAVRHEINARPIDWIRLEGWSATFRDESAACEAALCVREDDETLAEVAARAEVPVQPMQLLLETAGPERRNHLISARPGELLGPLDWDGQFRLILVHDKVLPAFTDPATRRRAEDAALRRAVLQEIERHVRWGDGWQSCSEDVTLLR